jgi:hypothetical protein
MNTGSHKSRNAGSRQTGTAPTLTANQQQVTQIFFVPVDQLFLDEENPRLAAAGPNAGQENLLRLLWKEMAVDEVAISIAVNGFFPEEQLFVVPRGKPDASGVQKYTVVEGNRRLAAVKLLRDPDLRAKLKATDLPPVRPDKASSLETLPVSIHNSRRDLWEYFGFRHINGAKPWDAYSKAMYVAKVHEEYGISIPQIALSIGDRHNTVSRFYRGYVLLRQAEEQAGFSKEDVSAADLSFSHLYTAAAYPEFQEFLGITPKNSLKPNPVPKPKLGHLTELMLWLYGSKRANKPPVIRTQFPDLNTLRSIVSSPSALSALRRGYSLDRAHDVSIGEDQRFREALVTAKEELLQAKATVTTGYSGELDLLDTMEGILQIGQSVLEEMRAKPRTSRRERK